MFIFSMILWLPLLIVCLWKFPPVLREWFAGLVLATGAYLLAVWIVQAPWAADIIKLYSFKIIFFCGSVLSMCCAAFLLRLGGGRLLTFPNAVIFFISGLVAIASFGDFYVLGVRAHRWPIHGAYTIIYIVWNFSVFLASIIALALKFKRSRDAIVSYQLKYVLWVLTLSGVGITLTNLLFPYFTNSSALSDMGSFWVLSFEVGMLVLIIWGKPLFFWRQVKACIEGETDKILVSMGSARFVVCNQIAFKEGYANNNQLQNYWHGLRKEFGNLSKSNFNMSLLLDARLRDIWQFKEMVMDLHELDNTQVNQIVKKHLKNGETQSILADKVMSSKKEADIARLKSYFTRELLSSDEILDGVKLLERYGQEVYGISFDRVCDIIKEEIGDIFVD